MFKITIPRETKFQEKLFHILEIITYVQTGCPYGDRLRLALSMMNIKFEADFNEILSGTAVFNGSHMSGIINIGLMLEENGVSFFPVNKNQRDRQIKLAKLFELKLTRIFNGALDSSIYRGESFYMFMESLCKF